MSNHQPAAVGPPAPSPLTLLEVFEPLNTAQLVRALIDVGNVYPEAVHVLVERARVRVKPAWWIRAHRKTLRCIFVGLHCTELFHRVCPCFPLQVYAHSTTSQSNTQTSPTITLHRYQKAYHTCFVFFPFLHYPTICALT